MRDPTAPAAQTEALASYLDAEPTDGAAPAAPKKPLALKPLLTPKSNRIATAAMPKFQAKAAGTPSGSGATTPTASDSTESLQATFNSNTVNEKADAAAASTVLAADHDESEVLLPSSAAPPPACLGK